MEINVFSVPSGLSVYWIETDFDDEDDPGDHRYIVATGSPEGSDERFIELLFASDGGDFNIDGFAGSPPQEVSTPLPREFLINAFTSAFKKADAWAWLDEFQPKEGRLDTDDPVQRRELVARYLKAVLI
jgi:hypothetical protein